MKEQPKYWQEKSIEKDGLPESEGLYLVHTSYGEWKEIGYNGKGSDSRWKSIVEKYLVPVELPVQDLEKIIGDAWDNGYNRCNYEIYPDRFNNPVPDKTQYIKSILK